MASYRTSADTAFSLLAMGVGAITAVTSGIVFPALLLFVVVFGWPQLTKADDLRHIFELFYWWIPASILAICNVVIGIQTINDPTLGRLAWLAGTSVIALGIFILFVRF